MVSQMQDSNDAHEPCSVYIPVCILSKDTTAKGKENNEDSNIYPMLQRGFFRALEGVVLEIFPESKSPDLYLFSFFTRKCASKVYNRCALSLQYFIASGLLSITQK